VNTEVIPPASEPAAEPPIRRAPLYASREKAYPRYLNKGAFRRIKWAAMAILLAFYWVAPWLRWDRGPGAPDQAILIDMPGRRAYFFFVEIWPQEVYYLTGLLIIAALTLFFVSALFGRVWCGFTCWQTVWTDLFVWIERWIEGERVQRMQLDKAPWTAGKAAKKLAKHALWLAVSVLTGYGFILYFNDAPTVTRQLLTGEAGPNTYGFMALFSVFPYVLAGFAREQVCIYMCPYARFQSAMFDEHSMIVSYEAWRGEPRGRLTGVRNRPAAELFAGRGHCVDCDMCVQACPTGIDIRNGSQLACIGCALCVDACNSVMDRFGLPRGLVSYDSSFNQVARAGNDASRRTRLMRPRTLIYLAAIGLVGAIMVSRLATRQTYDVSVLHERAPVYAELSGNRLRNGYTVKILNKTRQEGHFRLTVSGVANATVTVIGGEGEDLPAVDLSVPADSVGTFRLFVTAPRSSLASAKTDLIMTVSDLDNKTTERHKNLFAGPDMP
jgi:cytochrome c oxidase accessory protein FixG